MIALVVRAAAGLHYHDNHHHHHHRETTTIMQKANEVKLQFFVGKLAQCLSELSHCKLQLKLFQLPKDNYHSTHAEPLALHILIIHFYVFVTFPMFLFLGRKQRMN